MTWTAECGWLEAGSGMVQATVKLEVLPSVAGPFRHDDIGNGETMQVVSMHADEARLTAKIGLGGAGSWPPTIGATYPAL